YFWQLLLDRRSRRGRIRDRHRLRAPKTEMSSESRPTWFKLMLRSSTRTETSRAGSRRTILRSTRTTRSSRLQIFHLSNFKEINQPPPQSPSNQTRILPRFRRCPRRYGASRYARPLRLSLTI